MIVIPEGCDATVWNALPDGERLRKDLKKQALPTKTLHSALSGASPAGLSLQTLKTPQASKDNRGSFELLSAAGRLAADGLRQNPARVALIIKGFDKARSEQIARALILALAAHRFQMPAFRSAPEPGRRLAYVDVIGLGARFDVARTLAESRATNLTRWLTSLPPNKLDASAYRRVLQQLARTHGWKMDFLTEARLRRAGAGAFLAVAQGNATRDAGIAHLTYTPSRKAGKDRRAKNPAARLALVGKGIIFDTGGTNLKPFAAMLDMHHDMSGSAAALATLVALTELDYPHPVDCWLAITENRIGNTAYKPRDIVTASNGTTIEVIHTDAEGRMALADTLALAGKKKPAAIVDFATLTGTCVSALTDRYSGAFSNRAELHEAIIAAGRNSGERVWPFPLDDDFDEEIRSKVADVMQCAASGGGDHIQAARFLQRFVPDNCAWVHVDLSAASRKGGLAQVPTEVTGFGPRFALSLILDGRQSLLDSRE